MILSACILHNLLITTWIHTISRRKLAEIMDREARMRRCRLVEHRREELMESHMRRERLVDEMLEWDEDDIDLESYVL